MNTEEQPPQDPGRIDRLLDAIDLIKEERLEEARLLLRGLIREYNDFEDAWLWMSVVVDSLDQSELCLDNVLRVNPNNSYAAGALYRLRESEMRMHKRRARLRAMRDLCLGLMWVMVVGVCYLIILQNMRGI